MATLLLNGKVLIADGVDPVDEAYATAELYDPVANAWTTTGTMAGARGTHTATLLPNGKVLVAGGIDRVHHAMASAELYDPTTGSWSSAGVMARDPGTNAWSSAGTMGSPRACHSATALNDGAVLVVGGNDCCGPLVSTELYDPATNAWSIGPPMTDARQVFTATLLLDGRLLGARGSDNASAEIYSPATAVATPVAAQPVGGVTDLIITPNHGHVGAERGRSSIVRHADIAFLAIAPVILLVLLLAIRDPRRRMGR